MACNGAKPPLNLRPHHRRRRHHRHRRRRLTATTVNTMYRQQNIFQRPISSCLAILSLVARPTAPTAGTSQCRASTASLRRAPCTAACRRGLDRCRALQRHCCRRSQNAPAVRQKRLLLLYFCLFDDRNTKNYNNPIKTCSRIPRIAQHRCVQRTIVVVRRRATSELQLRWSSSQQSSMYVVSSARSRRSARHRCDAR